MNTKFIKLIDSFLDKVQQAEEIMKSHFSVNEPRLLVKSGIARNGKFGKYEYSFHGIGCCFSFEKFDVDYDYGAEERIDGFDLWRLSRYGEQFKEFREYINSGNLKLDFEHSINNGNIAKLQGTQSNLYYLSKSI